MNIDGKELVDMPEIAEMLGVTVATVRNWRYNGIMPEPTSMAGHKPLWRPSVIRKWSKQTGHPRPRYSDAKQS